MKADIAYKTIGQVQVLDLLGHFKGTLASRCLLDVRHQMAQQSGTYSVMLNTQRLESIDAQGAKAILESFKEATKCAVITRDTFAAELLLHPEHKNVSIFENTDEGIFFLGKEFAMDKEESDFVERRRFPRLPVALPVKTNLVLKTGKNLLLSMIATNLTFSGLFAKFAESPAEFEIRKNIDLFDLPLLDFKIRLSDRHLISAKGKVIHLDQKMHGIGVEFYEMAEPSEWLLKRFLDGIVNSSNSSSILDSTLGRDSS